MKQRLRNRVYLAAMSAFVYKTYSAAASHYGWPVVNVGDWNIAVDLIAYGLVGFGIHTSFDTDR